MTDFSENEAAIRALESTAVEAADAMDEAFARAGERMARSLARAAADGKVSLGELAAAVISVGNQTGGFGLADVLGGTRGAETSAPNVNVTLNMAGGASSLVRSEAQIASALNRAARMGLR